MPNPEQPKPITTPEEQEKLDEFLAGQKEQEQETETQEQPEKAEEEKFSKEESLEKIEQIERLLPEDDKLLQRWLETAKRAISAEKGNLEFAVKELETLAIMLRTRAAKEKNKKTKTKLQQAIALFGLLIAGYSTFSAEIVSPVRAETGAVETGEQERKKEFNLNAESSQEFLKMVEEASVNEVSPNNPVNMLLFQEAEIASQEVVEKAYQKLGSIIKMVKENIDGKQAPEDQLKKVHDILTRNFGIKFDASEKGMILLSYGLLKDKLDCDTATFIYLTIAKELNWPLFAVRALASGGKSGHLFVRWDDGKMRFNFETTAGINLTDEKYKEWGNISKSSIEKGIYLKNCSEKELYSDFYVTLGDSQSDSGDYQKAIKYYDKALDLDSNHVIAYSNRGNAEYQFGNYQGVIEDTTKAIKLDSSFVGAFNIRGLAQGRLKNYAEALKDFTKVIGLDPSSYRAHNNCGYAKYRLGDYEGALQDYKKSIELNPDFVSAYYNRAKLNYELGHYKAAIEDFSKLINIDPQDGDAYFYRGASKAAIGRTNEAIKDFKKAIELKPKLIENLPENWQQMIK